MRIESQAFLSGKPALCLVLLSPLVLLVHGYHPYAEDGGVYLPEIKRLLDPGLYPHGAEFVVGHLRYSLFAPVMAGLVRGSHFSLETVLLLVYVATFWMTLFAGWLLLGGWLNSISVLIRQIASEEYLLLQPGF